MSEREKYFATLLGVDPLTRRTHTFKAARWRRYWLVSVRPFLRWGRQSLGAVMCYWPRPNKWRHRKEYGGQSWDKWPPD